MGARDNKRILILGGTGEARRLAVMLLEAGYAVVTSLAGVTSEPMLPRGEVRSGGFGGVDGLVEYIAAENIVAIVDATHPFAEQITRHGFEAAKQAKISYVRMERRPWKPLARERWRLVADVDAAVKALRKDARVFVTIGRKDLPKFAARDDLSIMARSIEPPEMELPENWRFIQGRPPFSVYDEIELMRQNKIDTLVTKNAGGKAVSAKLQAARELGIEIIMIERPKIDDIRKVRSVDQVLRFLPSA